MILIWIVFGLVLFIGGLRVVIKGQVTAFGKEYMGTTARIIGGIIMIVGIVIPLILYNL